MTHTPKLGTVGLAALLLAECAPTRENQGSCKGAATVLGVLVGGTG